MIDHAVSPSQKNGLPSFNKKTAVFVDTESRRVCRQPTVGDDSKENRYADDPAT